MPIVEVTTSYWWHNGDYVLKEYARKQTLLLDSTWKKPQEENYSIKIQNRFAVQSSEFQEKLPDDKWELVKGTILGLQVAEEMLRRKKTTKKQHCSW